MAMPKMQEVRPQPTEAPEPTESAAKLKDEISLGDLNPLIHRIDLSNTEPLQAIARTQLERYGGIAPKMEVAAVFNPANGKIEPRFIARFEVGDLREEQITQMEQLVRRVYPVAVRTRTNSEGKELDLENYPVTSQKDVMHSNKKGWYMGPDFSPTTSHHMGLFVFKDLGEVTRENFSRGPESAGKYVVEIRDANLHQTDLVEFVTQVGSILKRGEMIDHGELLYETYYNLMRLALKTVDSQSVYGMEEVIAQIKRGLIRPLANPELSSGIEQQPESVLMVGVPGTGKTLVIEQLLHEDTGLFIVPLDPLELRKELERPKDKQTLLPRIAEVSRTTGRKVVLQVDDIENMVGDDKDTNSTLRNLMAGVRDSGFQLIASANHPEKIDEALLQPQRFGIIIHCGLQDEKARYEILNIHATSKSKKLEQSLFTSDETRKIILEEVVKLTDGFTPRYLAQIATVAKSYLLERVAKEEGAQMGLTEEDLDGHTFAPEDWERALAEVSSRYNKDEVKKRDKTLQQFVNRYRRNAVGFDKGGFNSGSVFSKEVYERFAAIHPEPPINS